MNEELSARLEELTRPTRTDIRRAKRAIMRLLEDGRARQTASLAIRASVELDAPADVERLEITFLERVDPDLVSPEDAIVRFVRGRIAARWAIAELAAVELILPVTEPAPGEETLHDVLAEGQVRIRIANPHGTTGVPVGVSRPALAEAYIRSPLAASELRWYLEPDIFAEELGDLELDDRSLRALREALTAFRRGLYVATASLLGVVSEAAWYRAAERLGTPGKLEEAVRDGATAQVQRLVADRLRGVPRLGAAVDELYSFASFYRELRNFGVHPALVRDDLDRYFAEEECGLLIMRTHNYLVRLSAAVTAALQADEGE
jgi:hypothetical protein